MTSASSPLTLTRSHSYSSLCKKVVRLTVANSLAMEEVLTVVSVERPIRKASMTVTTRYRSGSMVKVEGMTVTNVKYLGQPTTFAFTVDPTLVPAMPVTVRIDYDDGGPRETVTVPVTVRIDYDDGGPRETVTVTATVRIDYDDGTPQETVTLGEHLCAAVNPVAEALMHHHTYARFAQSRFQAASHAYHRYGGLLQPT